MTIILTERERAILASISRRIYREANELPVDGADSAAIHTAMFKIGMVLERMWRDDAAVTESASPPRVPGASAHPHEEGVESGPGQPIDICERLEASASEWDDQQDEDAILSREAAAEIRRLRAEVAKRKGG